MAGPRVLVIEDDRGIADLLARGLRLQGAEVTVAADGVGGRMAWAHGSFDVVLLDIMLPGINGIDLLAGRRRDGDATPVILMTARDDDRVRAAGIAAGSNAYLVKPFAYAELLATIDRLVAAGG